MRGNWRFQSIYREGCTTCTSIRNTRNSLRAICGASLTHLRRPSKNWTRFRNSSDCEIGRVSGDSILAGILAFGVPAGPPLRSSSLPKSCGDHSYERSFVVTLSLVTSCSCRRMVSAGFPLIPAIPVTSYKFLKATAVPRVVIHRMQSRWENAAVTGNSGSVIN